MTNASLQKRALLSVSDKTGLIDLARALIAANYKLLSTGGTARLLSEHDLPVTEVSSYTGFPEIMDGRVKTLHPKVHGGILSRREQDRDAMVAHEIDPIDVVVVNLYPFATAIADADCTLAHAIENIDIGGPAMIRAAAKNHQHVNVLVDPADYSMFCEQLTAGAETLASFRLTLACKAFAHTAAYDGMIANYLSSLDVEPAEDETQQASTIAGTIDYSVAPQREKFPAIYSQQFTLKQRLRYGENSHQDAAFYVENNVVEASVSTAVQHQGKALSFNNIADTDAALECVKEFEEPACVIVKHANPCGVACADTLLDAYHKAFQTDPTSAFGGIIAFNRCLDVATAQAIIEQQFVEVIVAPSIADGVLAITGAKSNVRVLTTGDWAGQLTEEPDYKRVNGGLLVQDRDFVMCDLDDLHVVTTLAPSSEQFTDLLFAWKVAKYVKSNAIVYAKNHQTVGVGAGQMSRVYSAKVAILKAEDEGLSIPGSVMASDAFFPFRDGVDAAAAAGVKAIIQPGGSVRDDEVIAAANQQGIAMVFTGTRHFKH